MVFLLVVVMFLFAYFFSFHFFGVTKPRKKNYLHWGISNTTNVLATLFTHGQMMELLSQTLLGRRMEVLQ